MTSPWRVLGVPRDASVADVRRAYARLLRKHRPDVDPVGFRRLRDAYEIALRDATARAAGNPVDGDDTDSLEEHAGEPGQGPAAAWFGFDARRRNEPARARPRALAVPLREALERARASGRAVIETRLHRILVRALRTRRNEPALADLVLAELSRPEGGLRRHLQPADVHGLRQSGSQLLRALLLAHVTADDWPALWAAVRATEALTASAADPEWLPHVIAAIEITALVDPSKAERLCNVAFRRGSPDGRTALGETDVWIQAGKQVVERAAAEDAYAIVIALCNPAVLASDPTAARALAFAATTPEAKEVIALLVRRFPAAEKQLELQIRRTRRQRRYELRRSDAKRTALGGVGAVVAVVGVVILFAWVLRIWHSGHTTVVRDADQHRRQEQPERAFERPFEEWQRRQAAKPAESDAGKEPKERR